MNARALLPIGVILAAASVASLGLRPAPSHRSPADPAAPRLAAWDNVLCRPTQVDAGLAGLLNPEQLDVDTMGAVRLYDAYPCPMDDSDPASGDGRVVEDYATLLRHPLLMTSLHEVRDGSAPRGKRRFVLTAWAVAAVPTPGVSPDSATGPVQEIYRKSVVEDVEGGAYDPAQAAIVRHNMRFGHMSDLQPLEAARRAAPRAIADFSMRIAAARKPLLRALIASHRLSFDLPEHTPASERKRLMAEGPTMAERLVEDTPRAYPETARGWIDGPALRSDGRVPASGLDLTRPTVVGWPVDQLNARHATSHRSSY